LVATQGTHKSEKKDLKGEIAKVEEPMNTKKPAPKQEVAELREVIDEMMPLYLVGMAARQGFLENTKRIWKGNGWVEVRGEADVDLIEARNIAVHQGNFLADLSLVKASSFTKVQLEHFNAVYGLTPDRMTPKTSRSEQMLDIINMKRSMVACYSGTNFSRNKIDDKRFDKLYDELWAKWDSATFLRDADTAAKKFAEDKEVDEMFKEMKMIMDKFVKMVCQSMAKKKGKN
jgi:hypothetical protein